MRYRTMLKWIAIIGASIGTFFVAKRLLGDEGSEDIAYSVDRARPYGKYWGTRRPPGLPEGVRRASVDEGAEPYIAAIARDQRLGEDFVRTMLALADKESSMTFARPANNFDLREPVTAWGVFQWNEGAWERLGETDRDYLHWTLRGSPVAPRGELKRFPWQQTAFQEIAWPIRYYARIWRTVKIQGGGNLAAARAVFMWHSGPTRLRRYLAAAERYGWTEGWRQVGQDLSSESAAWYREKTESVDQRLRDFGVLTL